MNRLVSELNDYEVDRIREGFRSNSQLYGCAYLGNNYARLVNFLDRVTSRRHHIEGRDIAVVSWTDAISSHAVELSMVASKSFATRRLRSSHAKVRSTTLRRNKSKSFVRQSTASSHRPSILDSGAFKAVSMRVGVATPLVRSRRQSSPCNRQRMFVSHYDLESEARPLKNSLRVRGSRPRIARRLSGLALSPTRS